MESQEYCQQFFGDPSNQKEAQNELDPKVQELAAIHQQKSLDDFKLNQACEPLFQILKDFEPAQIALSFNGGKDCTVAMHLLKGVCSYMDSVNKTENTFQKIKYVHFVKDGEFEEISQFRSEMEQTYNIQVKLYSADFKGEVQRLIDEEDVKAIIMGNRRTDPYSQNLEAICKSSAGWPDFTRVFPILDWQYCDVWDFLIANNLSYCNLYDLGYTSLGEKHNSQKNPYLQVEDEDLFMPAYCLTNDEQERYSRRDPQK